MKQHAGSLTAKRSLVGYAAIGASMFILLTAFFRLQVLGNQEWTLRAESNRIRQLPVAVPRGSIFDRHGRVVADNVPGYAIVVLPTDLSSFRSTLERISEHARLSPSVVESFIRDVHRHGVQPIVIDSDVDFVTMSAIEERRDDFPDVFVEVRPRRRYPAGRTAAHVVGYVGEISSDELDLPEFPAEHYRPGMVVGKNGLERRYEHQLQGSMGYRYVETDARGRIVGDFREFRQESGVSGADLHLNLDLGLQEWIHRVFPDSLPGAVVALDVADGGVLALYSTPTYDPNDFVGGIAPLTWELLNSDPALPLFHRAVLGLYPPASTWKLAVAAIGLEGGYIEPDDYLPAPCTGGITIAGEYRRCWEPAGHGHTNLTEAIATSCNVYFYQLGMMIGLDRLLERSNDIGFRSRCGIDLPNENEGRFPEGRDYWQRVHGYRARENEVLSLAIGQGPNSQTPLKIAQFYLALARDGSAPPPALAQDVELGEGWVLNIGPDELVAIREGLKHVTAPGGTAHYGTALEHWQVMGKTGTAQNTGSVRGEANDHAWFAGMAGPWDGPPEVVIVVMVEYGASGSTAAAPVMAKAADYYLRVKHGIPVDTLQTYLDHVRAGPVPEWYRERYR